ncbi:MAG: MoxR family ATPase [Phycisphaeraceae bacterium]|nr:MoxR family ATPase [Phycisphaeraceae bacterium]
MSEPISDDLKEASRQLSAIKTEMARVIHGQDRVLEQMLIAIMTGGHALLEGVPGTAKTLTVRVLALTLSCRAKRIQFTPDLMPSDVIGTNVFNLATNTFALHQGPIFTDLLLGDEINRAPAKTQSALLEAMSERHATIDGVRYELSPIFTVFATQNPVEFEGTYPLPEAQLDRFLLKIAVEYPDINAERAVLEAVHRGTPSDRLEAQNLKPVLDVQGLLRLRAMLPSVRVEPGVMDYCLKITRATREHDSILLGAGPRGSIYLLMAAKARALLQGRDFVTPDDFVAMAQPVLGHRLTLTADSEISGVTRDEVLQSILDKIEVPR